MKYENRLIQFGLVLFLLGLLTGFGIPVMSSPRLGLSGHLEGVMNGMFLILIGLIWNRLQLSEKLLKSVFYSLIFGTYVNWMTVLLAALWGAGGEMMPIAGGSLKGTVFQEILVKIGLVSLSLAILYACTAMIIGLKKNLPS